MTRWREFAAAFLACSLIMTPAWGASVSALGTIVAADRASVSGAGAEVGTTIFSGDKLSTGDAGSVQLRAGAARFLLSESSVATVSEMDGIPSATLLRGTATFSTASAKAFALMVSTAVIRAKSDQPTVGQAGLIDAKHLIVKCMRGTLTISVGDDTREIPEGTAYRVVLEPSNEEAQQQPPPEGSGTKGSGRPPLMAAKSKFVWYAVGAVAVVTFLAIQEAVESPDRP